MKRKKQEPLKRKPSRYPTADEKNHHLPNKVSEAQAASYGIPAQVPGFDTTKILKPYSSRLTKTQKQLLPVSQNIGGIEMPDAVRQFAQKNALFPHLETALRLVHASFPSLKSVKLAYEVDWEVDNESWIGINIQISGETDQVLEQYLFFNRQMTQQIPPEKSGKILLGIGGLSNA